MNTIEKFALLCLVMSLPLIANPKEPNEDWGIVRLLIGLFGITITLIMFTIGIFYFAYPTMIDMINVILQW